jgi:hypothetical protein
LYRFARYFHSTFQTVAIFYFAISVSPKSIDEIIF